MKRLSTGVLAALIVGGLGLNAVAAPSNPASPGNLGPKVIAQASPGATSPAPPADFGSPPSGEYPILYNDHHVYSKPDTLKRGRVLAALIRNGTILIPLRSMFEQMGATVSYNPRTKTVDVSKPGADVKVTVGKPEVIINGESRPLDVPPEIYHGVVVVPVRVISEGMGAYVQWVPDRKIVVVRYLPPTPPPPPATAPPATAPPATPAPTAAPTPYKDIYVAGDYIINPKVYNEFSPGNHGSSSNGAGASYRIHGAYEFNLGSLPWMLEADYRQFSYPHKQFAPTPTGSGPFPCTTPGDPGCVTTIGGLGSTFVPAFNVRDYDFDGRLGLRVANPRIYIGVGYMARSNNAGYPHLNGVGFGAEKLPDLDHVLSVYGGAWYYPTVKGNFTDPAGNSFKLSYSILKYDVGIAYDFGPTSPVFLEAGFLGDHGKAKNAAPSDFSENGPYVGIGLKF